MNRLQSEVRRLYALPSGSATEAASSSALLDADGRVRALVLELARPASWDLLGKVWHGVQNHLKLPAPAIAISGVDGLQLWFSLQEPVAVQQARGFLEALRLHFLADVAPERVRVMPGSSTASATALERLARMIPSQLQPGGNWSAFVAPDLAPIFAETPWLDIPPGDDGQAALLRVVDSISPDAFAAALARLQVGVQPSTAAVADSADTAGSSVKNTCSPLPADSRRAVAADDARRFLLQVMNDSAVDLAFRVEAARALLHAADSDPSLR